MKPGSEEWAVARRAVVSEIGDFTNVCLLDHGDNMICMRKLDHAPEIPRTHAAINEIISDLVDVHSKMSGWAWEDSRGDGMREAMEYTYMLIEGLMTYRDEVWGK